MMRYFVWTWSLLLVMQNVAGQERCTTPAVLQGTCLNIINNFKECPAIINVLRKPRPLQQSDLDFLKMSQCGFDGEDPKFCCKKELEEDHVYDVSDHPNLRLLDNDKCGLTSYRKPVRCYSNYEDMNKELAENHGSIPELDNPIERFLYENICIIERNIYRPLIFDGSGTELFSFPWMALIAFITSAQYPEFRCGGSLINKRYVLTAAHCVTMLPEGFKLFGVRLGEHDLTTEIDCPSGVSVPNAFCASKYQDFGVETVHFHPKYSKAKLQNDIALIRLDNDVNFTANNVKPICLSIKSIKSYIPTELTVTGWGATENENKPVPEGKIGRIDSCSGDSGGPLQASALYYSEFRNVQYGIVSYGLGTCGTIGFPGVYTNVSYYLKWILDTMRA